MIDIENELFTGFKAAMPQGVKCSSSYEREPSSFPFATLIVEDNHAYERTQDSGCLENHAEMLIEINYYSNKKNGAKSECKSLMALGDSYMANLGFTRSFTRFIPNLDDSTIKRMTARYRAVVDVNHKIYRR